MGKDAEPKLYTESDMRFLKEHVARLLAVVEEQAQRIEELELQVARMQRTSATSSKPPSSDITKPPRGGGSASGGRGSNKPKPGGQKGHEKYERELFKPDEVDDHWQYTLDEADGLEPIPEGDPDQEAWRIVQQIDWTGRSLKIVEHRARRYRCIYTGRIIVAPLPEGVRRGELLSPGMIGLIVCDYFSAYRKCLEDMEHVEMQFCWSHLIRDLKFLLTLPALIAQRYGTRVLAVVRQMFGLWHRRGELGESYYRRAMSCAKTKLLKAAKSKSNHPEVRKLAARLTSRYADSYFTFMNYRGVDPTNNRTEQQIRFVVIGRKVIQGTKAEIGKQWCQRIWTALATCRQRGKQLYNFLVESIEAKLGNRRCYPSLIY